MTDKETAMYIKAFAPHGPPGVISPNPCAEIPINLIQHRTRGTSQMENVVTIRPVANGYIVEPDTPQGYAYNFDEIYVFNSLTEVHEHLQELHNDAS